MSTQTETEPVRVDAIAITVDKHGRLGRPLSWPRVLAEAAAIVFSILLAFAIDAWWDGLGQRRDERDILTALRSEFVAAQAEIDRARAVHTARQASVVALLAVMGPSPTAAELDTAGTQLWGILRMTTLDVPQGTLSSLVGGGRAARLRDQQFERQLMDWPGRLADHEKTEDNVRSFIREHLFPWIALRTPMPPFNDSSVFQVDLKPVLGNYEFENYLRWLQRRNQVAINENTALRAQVDTILQRIDQSRAR